MKVKSCFAWKRKRHFVIVVDVMKFLVTRIDCIVFTPTFYAIIFCTKMFCLYIQCPLDLYLVSQCRMASMPCTLLQ